MYTGSPPLEPWETDDWQWFHEHRQVITESDWLTCPNPGALLDYLNQRDATTSRKFFLAGVGCVRRVWNLLERVESRNAVEAAELFADGYLSRAQLEVVNTTAEAIHTHWSQTDPRAFAALAAWRLRHCVRGNHGKAEHTLYVPFEVRNVAGLKATTANLDPEAAQFVELRTLANLYRCVLGNPFRPVTFTPEWRTDTVRTLAAQMYESRDFSAMPILADALQDAGCNSDDILNHCREPGEHVRGCWVVDLVLGKS